MDVAFLYMILKPGRKWREMFVKKTFLRVRRINML